MRRYIAGLGLAGLIFSIGMSCSSKDEEGDDGSGEPDAGPVIDLDAGEPDVVDIGPCGDALGLGQDCAAQEQAAQLLEVNILLVMDKSGSMNETPEGYTMSKWLALREALSAALNDVQNSISFGLEFFPVSATLGSPIPANCGDSNRCCEMPGGANMNVNVGPGTQTVPEIVSALDSSDPAGGTPTTVALIRAYDYFFSGPGADLSGGKYVLLATDGGPNCNPQTSCSLDTCTLNMDNSQGCPPDGFSCCDTTPTACLDDNAAVAQIQQLNSIGVTTIVVGIPGSEVYDATLNAFADAGGFAQDGATSYYQVSAEGGVEELTQTFRDITTALVTDCRLPVQDVNWAEVNRNEVNVAVECQIVPYAAETPADTAATPSWWRYDNPENPSAVLIEGAQCERIQSTGVDRIDAVFGCPQVTVM